MHVGLVVYGGLKGTSGGFRYDRMLRTHLDAAGDRVDVVSLPWRSYRRGLVDGLDPRIRDRLDEPYDVLIQDELCHPSLWRHNRRLDRPAVVVSLVHLLQSGPHAGPARPVYRAIERRYLDSVDAVVATSDDTDRRVQALVDRPSVIAPPAGRHDGPAVDPETVATRAADGPLSIAFVGTLVPRKGLHTLLDALAQIDVEWRLSVIGSHGTDPSYVDRMEARIDAYGFGDVVDVHGSVSACRLERELARAHVLAVPSQYESVGMVYLEAMEYGVVPIATTIGGASEFITHRRDGLLVPPELPSRLAGHLSRLATDRAQLVELGHGALETAQRRPDWTTSMDRLRQFLVDQLEEERSRPAAVDAGPAVDDGSEEYA